MVVLAGRPVAEPLAVVVVYPAADEQGLLAADGGQLGVGQRRVGGCLVGIVELCLGVVDLADVVAELVLEDVQIVGGVHVDIGLPDVGAPGEVVGVGEAEVALLRPLGGDEYHAVGGACAINGRRRGILQHGDFVHVLRGEVVEVGGV